MIQFNVFPGGKKRIVTFSYDDGHINDARLVALFNKYGVKGTFHLNDKRPDFDKRKSEMRELYKGHEISCHTSTHGYLSNMPTSSIINEVFENRKALEEIAGYPVIGMSYPSGDFSKEVENALEACGIVYSRTVIASSNFALPDNFLEWHPTCHHKNALPLCERFMENLDSQWTRPLFYIWGHAHELKCEDDWALMEKIVSTVAGNDKIWYATNIEIYNYRQAQRSLVVSADEKILYNPSALDVWVEKDKTDVICIKSGATVTL